MSRENVEVVSRIYEAASRRDADAVLALYHPDVEWDGSRLQTVGATDVIRGHEGIRRLFHDWHEAWEEVEDDCEELIDAGEYVVSVVTRRGRGRTSGVEVELPNQSGVWSFRDGKVVRVVWFRSREDALEAAGVRR